VRASASRHGVRASSTVRSTRAARRPLRTHRLLAAISAWGRMKAGDACAFLQAPRLGSGNAQCSGWRDGPRRFDGDARRKHAHVQSRRAAILTLLDVPLHVWRGAVLVRTRSAVQTGATNNVARSSEVQSFTTGMNAWPGLSEACADPNMATCRTTSPQTPTITFDRRLDGPCCSVADAFRRRL